MELNPEQQSQWEGQLGPSAQTAMRILRALGNMYGARRMVPIASAQIAGVSYDNLGDAGLEWLAEMAAGGGRVRVLTTLNPAGMDLMNWRALGIPEDFAEKQLRVIDSFARMGVTITCTCTPYLAGNVPARGESVAWAESSAVCYANSILGARTNREGGPSALAAALAGCTPEYGMHLEANRCPGITVDVRAHLSGSADFGALGKLIGERLESMDRKRIPLIRGINAATLEEQKAICASIATYGGLALFYLQGISPDTEKMNPPPESFTICQADLDLTRASLSEAWKEETDFFSLGCPHLSLPEIIHAADLMRGHTVRREFWITTSRPVKQLADAMGITADIEAAGVRFAVDTCCVVAPIRNRFSVIATDSAKACYYARAKHSFRTRFLDFDSVIQEALEV
jgi:predicted aconitase